MATVAVPKCCALIATAGASRKFRCLGLIRLDYTALRGSHQIKRLPRRPCCIVSSVYESHHSQSLLSIHLFLAHASSGDLRTEAPFGGRAGALRDHCCKLLSSVSSLKSKPVSILRTDITFLALTERGNRLEYRERISLSYHVIIGHCAGQLRSVHDVERWNLATALSRSHAALCA